MKKRLGAISAAMIDRALAWKEGAHTISWDMADAMRTSIKNAQPSLDVKLDCRNGTYYIMTREG